jgi:CPA2 family monovalent cation:H+ antiporter-2
MHDPAQLLIELGAVITALGLITALSSRVGISPIPLYLLAGLAFGKGGLLPLATSHDFISTGAEVGVVLLLFTLGLEYAPDELLATLRKSAPVGLADLVLNGLPGAVCALLLGWGPTAALALAGVTFVTSSGVTAQLLSDLGWSSHRETRVVLSLLVLEDLTMAAYLPILTAVLAGVGVLTGLRTVAIAAVAVTLIMYISLRHGRLVESFVASPNEEVLLLKVLGLTLLVAGVAEKIQVSAAVGAFLVGIALSGPVAHSARVRIAPLREVFAAVFFVFFGLQTSPPKLVPVLGPAALLAVVGLITKISTGYLAAARAQLGRPERIRAGVALVARGEFSIVIGGLAVAAGVNPHLGPVTAAYVFILAVSGPLIARAADPLAARFAHQPALAASPAPSASPGPATSPAPSESSGPPASPAPSPGPGPAPSPGSGPPAEPGPSGPPERPPTPPESPGAG